MVSNHGGPVGAASAQAPAETWCCEMELSGDRPVRAVTSSRQETCARVLVRLHGEPLGYVTSPLGPDGLDREAVSLRAIDEFREHIGRHLIGEGLSWDGGSASRIPEATGTCPNGVRAETFVSVVVCTRDRAAILRDCLATLRRLTYPRLEIIVVDNAPTGRESRAVVEEAARSDQRFRYVCEPRPGLSRARNCGIRHARGEVIAYTDDDVAVDPAWVHGLIRGFQRRDDVGCVTGLVSAASITGDAARYFDARADWSAHCEPRLFHVDGTGAPNSLYPYSPGIFGTGANIAFRREVLDEVGGFDEALGAGTRSRGGEDLDMFVRVLRHGRALAYEPSAIVWHRHRSDLAALHQQLFGYGTGFAAFMTKCLLNRETRWEVLQRIPLGLRRLARVKSDTAGRLGAGVKAPRGALAREFAGFAAGPVLYLRDTFDPVVRHRRRG